MLTKTEGDPENDGLLEAREIMNMNLNAELAVLSACETASGRIAPGEGVMGMSWAFFVAGTRSMLVSQWKVNSASTSQLMMNFYENLRSKEDHPAGKKAQALREAALRLMKNERYHHPFYWGWVCDDWRWDIETQDCEYATTCGSHYCRKPVDHLARNKAKHCKSGL